MAQQLQLQQQQKSKKKLGQNLNKLIPVALSKDNGKATASANPHGLLLLSGSRKSSSFGSPDASLLSKGAAAAAAKDAWGVVKQQQQQPQENVKPKNVPLEEKPKEEIVSAVASASADASSTAPLKDASLSAASWDDYGGRGGAPSPVAKTTTNTNAVLRETSAVSSSAASVAATHDGSISSSSMAQRAAEIKHKEELRQKLQMERAAARLKELDAAKSAAVVPLAEQPRKTLYEPNTSTATVTTTASDKNTLLTLDRSAPPIPTTTTTSATAIIHLTSYEDRDRGEKRTSTPRMLYDPKSGSMVAVKDPATTSAPKTTTMTTSTREARKSRKSQQPTTLLKRSVPSPTASHESNSSGKAPPSPMVATTAPGRNTNKRGGGRKDVVASVAPIDGKPTDKLTMANATSTARGRNATKRGGRNSNATSNSTARSGSNTAANNNSNRRSRGGRSRNGRKDEDEGDMYNNNGTYGVALYTGFDPQALEHTGMQQHYYTADEHEEEEEVMPVFEVLKADDKIELLTGEDDSPTLKPTAKVFAPSQAALAAAAAARSDAKADQYHSNNNTDDDDDEEDDDGPLGLDFDPPFDMDGLMQSPIVPAGSLHHGDFDLNALKLDPPLNNNDNGLPRHIFAFGSSGTWGDAQVHSSTDWDVPIVGLGGRGGLFGDVSDTFGLAKSKDSASVSESFLNLPTGSAWGGFGKGGISAAENQKTGD